MERRWLAVLCCFVLFFYVSFVDTFSLRSSLDEDGSKRIATPCSCRSVEVWLIKRTNSDPELPSYQYLMSKKSLLYVIKNEKRLRLRLRKHCNLLQNQGDVSVSDTRLQNKVTNLNGSIEVKVKQTTNCVSFWMECSGKLYCGGIDLVTEDGISQSTARKLLMVLPENQDNLSGYHRGYGIILSGFVLCAMVILIALCGSPRNSLPEEYSKEGDVEVISSEKIQTIQRESIESIPRKNKLSEEKQERIPVKTPDHVVDITQDDNCNNPTTTIASNEYDVIKTDVVDNTTTVQDKIDGQVLAKESQGSGKKQDNKSKNRTKVKVKDEGVQETRTNTYPASSFEAKEKGLGKGKISFKSYSFTAGKKEKKKKKSNSQDDLTQENRSNETQEIKVDRRSFVSRELPQLPGKMPGVSTNEDNYAEPFDRKNMKPVSQKDLEEDDNYEVVSNQVRSGRIVSAKDEIRNSLPLPSTIATPDVISNVPANENVDVFDDAIPASTYEEVCQSTKRTLSEPLPHAHDALYESVDNANSPIVYDEPSDRRHRSASHNLFDSGTPKIESERKSSSLPRTKGPEPPSLHNLKSVVRQMSKESDELPDDIEPYTITTKKGDYIVQETSLPSLPITLPNRQPERQLTAAEIDTLYSKVDKEKQKKDREEMEQGKESESEEEIVNGKTDEKDDDEEDHQYEVVQPKRFPQNFTPRQNIEEEDIELD